MMRARKLKYLVSLSAIIFALQAFRPISPITPANSNISLSEPYKSESSVINPDAYDSARGDAQAEKKQDASSLKEFVSSLINGDSGSIRGIYKADEFRLPVVQQPSGNPGFVSIMDDVVTEFSMPRKYGVTGIIAHNYLAGKNFFNLEIGELIQVVYGDGEILTYEIIQIESYQALSPDSPTSQFVDLATSEKLSATQLFKRVYMGRHHLTLQTCIQNGNEDSWGRLFIIAQPV